MDHSTSDLPVPHHLPEFAKFMPIESVMPFSHLILCHRLLLLPSIFLSIRVFSSELTVHFRSLNFSTSPSSEYSGLMSFKVTGLISLRFKGLSRVFSSTIIWKHQFFGAQPFLWSNSHICLYVTTGKTIILTIWIFVSRVMSLLFNTLSRFVIALLSRSNCLLISWLQILSTVILEPKKKKLVTASIISPSIYHEVMGPDVMILVCVCVCVFNIEFSENSSLWPIHLRGPCRAWLIASLSYANPFTMKRQRSMKKNAYRMENQEINRILGFCSQGLPKVG